VTLSPIGLCSCWSEGISDPLLVCAGLEKQLTDFKEAAQYLMDIDVPQEEGAEPRELLDCLDEADGRMKALLLDTSKLAAVTALAAVEYHEPSFDLQKVTGDVDLSELVNREDVQAAAEEVVKKFDL
jgi:hypothetical protein